MYDRLNEGGIVTYWLPLHGLSDRSAKAIIKAFANVFPDASLWHGWREDVMLVGTRNGGGDPVEVDWFERQWRQPAIAAELKAVGIEQPEQLGALFIGDQEYLAQLTSGVLPLVDNYPKRILADSVLGQGASQFYQELLDADSARIRFAESEFIRSVWPQEMIGRTDPYFDIQEIIEALIDLSGHPLGKNLFDLHTIMTETALTAPALWYLGSVSDVQRILVDLSPEERTTPVWQYQIAAGHFSERRYADATEALRLAEEDPGLFPAARLFRVYALCLAGQQDEATRIALDAYTRLSSDSRLDRWWQFLRDEFDVDVTPSSPRYMDSTFTVIGIEVPDSQFFSATSFVPFRMKW